MANWFEFAGTRSTTHGVYVQDFPPLTLPEERVRFEPVPGRSGALTLLEGDAVYDDIVLSVECFVRDLSKLDAIGAWLRGRGALVLGNMPDRYYDARCVNQIELAKVLRGRNHRTFAAVFRCKPFRYVYPAPAPIALTNGGSITNPGTVDAVPTITVIGTGTIDLTIGDRQITIYELPTDTEITIDCEAGKVFSGTTNMTSKVSFDRHPWAIPPGIHAVSWHVYGGSAVTSVKISRPWRYI